MKKKAVVCLTQFAEKHRWLKIPCLFILTIYLFVFHLFANIVHNYRKITCIVLLMVGFGISSSFSYDNFTDKKNGEIIITDSDTKDDMSELQENKELIEDKDVTEGYENSEFEIVTKEEQFQADDILEQKENVSEKEEKQGGISQMKRDDWQLVLINKQHSIPKDYTFTLGKIKGSMKCDERVVAPFFRMLKAAQDDGVNLVICSPYRDMNRQKVLFNRKINAYMKKGMSYMEAYRTTAQAVTVPGASEHQIGLAIDIVCDEYTALNEGFGETEAGKWLREHSFEYGFILRYPKGKEYITGIEYEPWHYRYVGTEAAKIITEEGITLEEFVDMLPNE